MPEIHHIFDTYPYYVFLFVFEQRNYLYKGNISNFFVNKY